MPRAPKKIDRPYLFAVIALTVTGMFIFSSASLGLMVRGGKTFSDLIFSQFFLGLGGGIIALLILVNIPYRSYRAVAPYLFGVSLFLTALVFVPIIGVEANGARRWLDLFGVSFQPAEFLKITFVLALAWYYSMYYRKMNSIQYSLGGLCGALGVMAIVLLLQPDTGTFLILASTGVAMAMGAGVQFKHLALLGVVLLIGVVLLVLMRPYLLERVKTLIDPMGDPDASYQIKQSLIGIGSGGWFGRGYGQGVQKFKYLPEPSSDSIFSVAAEEFGFMGCVLFILMYAFLAIRGLYIASWAPDRFGGLTVIGIVILIATQSFINIGSVVGLVPFTGEPLTFISHGGTALLFTFIGVGIVLNISRYKTVRQN